MRPNADDLRRLPSRPLPVPTNWASYIYPWLWGGLLITWTWMLLMPIPDSAKRLSGPDLMFWFGKGLHVTAYAVLSVLTWLLPVRESLRWLMIFLLIGHGGITEFFQQFVGRGSSWLDWGRDVAGIFLGTVLARGGRSARRRRQIRQCPVQDDSPEKHDHTSDLR